VKKIDAFSAEKYGIKWHFSELTFDARCFSALTFDVRCFSPLTFDAHQNSSDHFSIS
jgi:hypothetical protein